MKRELTCTYYFIILIERIFKRAHQTPNADVYILGCGISFPQFQLAFHIYYVKYENTLT